MDRRFKTQLDWIDAQHERLCGLVAEWASINSGSRNVPGLGACTRAVAKAFEPLCGDVQRIDLGRDFGRALRITKRPEARRRVLLAIHADTVYGPDDPFRQVTLKDPNTLCGPGVVDAKGGLAVMLAALEALERSPVASNVGWDVLINPDEELGSPASAPLFAELAKGASLGLLFEPALPDGALVSARKGSGNFTVTVTGRAAHVGRDFDAGRNAIHALAGIVSALAAMNGGSPGLTVNVGRVEGGGALNVVPDRATCGFNVRVQDRRQQRAIEQYLRDLPGRVGEGISASVAGSFTAPPKPLDAPTLALLEHVRACGEELGLDVTWHETGGTCDGNRLAAAGLPNVDSLGPRGGGLHSPAEFLLLDSLTERAKLTALLLMKLAAGELQWPRKEGA